MVRINKVVTKKGDGGETSLASGQRVRKDHPRVEATGQVDELNSLIGLVRCFNLQKPASLRRDKLEVIFCSIQQRLFDLGAIISAGPESERAAMPELGKKQVDWLEEVIEQMNEELEPLASFILPGGGPLNAFLHQSRTVCRRAEREVIRLASQEAVDPWAVPYLNRLSDALFVFGRWVVKTMGEGEFLWQPGKQDAPDWRWK